MHKISVAVLVIVACRPSDPVRPAAAPGEVRIGIGNLAERMSAERAGAYRKQVEHAAPPLSLSPPDGNELELRAIDAAVTIQGPLAHTELHVTFHNTEARIREGRFSITLPAGAAVGRFAMKIGEVWREARVVSRARGREVYESFLKQRVDPALLEQDIGNQFSARVFPIAADADKELVIAYDHVVSASQPYVLALKGLPAIPSYKVTIDHDGRRDSYGGGKRVAPDDVVVTLDDRAEAVAVDGAVVARVEPIAAGTPAPLDRVLILVDTSASRATVMGRQADLVRQLASRLPGEVAIASFDHGVTELYRGPASDARVDGLYDHGALGGSNLAAALAYAKTAGMSRVVIVGDGAPTLGEWEPAKLAAIAAGSVDRIDAVSVGQSVDRDALGPIVRAGRQPGAILDGGDAARVARQLASALPAERSISIDGATATWPATTRGVAPGEPVWVFGVRTGNGPLTVRVGDRATQLSPAAADGARIRRAVAGAEIAALTEAMAAAPDKERGAIAKRIETLALEHKLVSSQTSLIVLETDADERRMLDTPAQPAAPVTDRAPTIDPTSTTQGITIDRNYIRNIPVPGRTFDAALGAAAGAQNDSKGVSFSGATSLENQYVVEGLNTSGHGGAEMIQISASAPSIDVTSASPSAQPHRPTYIDNHFSPSALGLSPPPRRDHSEPPPPAEPPPPPSPYLGQMAEVMEHLAHGRRDRALEVAAHWQLGSPGDVSAIVSLGEAFEARGDTAAAQRAYASLVDLYPNRPEMMRAAGERLERVALRDPAARALAIDAYRRAIRERPDHVSTYRLLAYALVRDGRGEEALDVLWEGRKLSNRPSITQIMMEDTAIIGAVVIAEHPELAEKIRARMPGNAPVASMRIVLTWETDANDVDLHVTDKDGGHAWYGSRVMPSGGSLRDDVTTGFGPEMFEVDHPSAYPYKVSANYFRMGPEGVGLGSTQVIYYDGAGHITVDDRPFALQNGGAMLELGVVERPR
jgi:hypothetical protein